MDTVLVCRNLFSDETTLHILYLEQLWNDNDFRQEWTRLYESFTAKWLPRAVELAERVEQGDMSLLTECIVEASQGVLTLALRRKTVILPLKVIKVLWWYLISEPLKNLDTAIYNEIGHTLGVIPLRFSTSGESRLNDIATLLWATETDAEMNSSGGFPESPIRGLRSPFKWESKETYLNQIRILLEAEAELIESGKFDPRVHRYSLLKEHERKRRYSYTNLRRAIESVLLYAEDYYEKCAATQGTQVSNRSDETLRRYARVVYLNLVKGRTLGQIAAELKLPRSTVQDALESGMKLLGLEKPPKSVRNR